MVLSVALARFPLTVLSSDLARSRYLVLSPRVARLATLVLSSYLARSLYMMLSYTWLAR